MGRQPLWGNRRVFGLGEGEEGFNMELLDILDEIQGRQIQKTETGDERVSGVMTGIVEENFNKDLPGYVRVRIPVRDDQANVLKWAKVARPYSGDSWGCYFHPEKGDQVLLIFENGNIEKPYVLASIPRDSDSIVRKAADEKNQIKGIVTKNGSCIQFIDHPGDSVKDQIHIMTAGEKCRFLLDNEREAIMAEDKERTVSIEMDLKDKAIHITAEKKLTIQVGDSILVTMNGGNGAIVVEADKIQAKAGRALELQAGGSAKISAQQAMIEASSVLKQSSGGMLTVTGNPVKIG